MTNTEKLQVGVSELRIKLQDIVDYALEVEESIDGDGIRDRYFLDSFIRHMTHLLVADYQPGSIPSMEDELNRREAA